MFTFLSLKINTQFLLLVSLLVSVTGVTQTNNDKRKTIPTGYSKSVSAGMNITVPEFSQTHSFGIGARFSWSKHRFGLMQKKPSKLVGFIADGGIDYYFGRKESVSGYPYQYKGFTFIHTYAGIIYNSGRGGNVNLTIGPALGSGDGVNTFFWGINLNGAYYIKEKVGIAPGIHLMKDPKSYDPLLSGSIKINIAF